MGYWSLVLKGTFVRHRWLSPPDLRGGLHVARQVAEKCRKSRWDWEGRSEISQRSIGYGAENPMIISRGSLIQTGLTVDLQELLHGGERCGGTWLSHEMQPEYRMLGSGKLLRKPVIEIWLGGREIVRKLGGPRQYVWSR